MRRGGRADWRDELVTDQKRDPNISSNERGIEPGSGTRPSFSLSKQPCGALQHFVPGTPCACFCKELLGRKLLTSQSVKLAVVQENSQLF